MRITGGQYRGRILQSPQDKNVRPTSDKVRQAIFNILHGRGLVLGAHVLDAFCGTGALGLESISRGAASCVFVDKNKISLDLARANAAPLKIEAPLSFLLKDSSKIGAKPDHLPPVDLVFLDPPYGVDLVPASVDALRNGGWFADEASIVIETETEFDPAMILGVVDMVRDYGDTRIALLTLKG